MTVQMQVSLSAETLSGRARRPFRATLDGDAPPGRICELLIPDGSVNLPLAYPQEGQTTGLLLMTDVPLLVTVGPPAENQALALMAGGCYALLAGVLTNDVPLQVTYTPGTGIPAHLLFLALGTGDPPPAPLPPLPECSVASAGLMLCWDMNEATGNRVDHVRAVPLTPVNAPVAMPSLYAQAVSFSAAAQQYLWHPDPFSATTMGSANAYFHLYGSSTTLLWIYVESYPANLGETFEIQNSAGLMAQGPIGTTSQIASGQRPEWAMVLKHTGTLFITFAGDIAGGGTIGGIGNTGTGLTEVIPLRQWTLVQVWRVIVPSPTPTLTPGLILSLQVNNGPILTMVQNTFAARILQSTLTNVGAAGASGGSGGATFRYFDGKIDRVMMWNRALTTLERQALWGDFPALPVLPPGYSGVWSTRRLVAAYAGPLLRIRRSSDQAELDIGVIADDLDTGTLLSFVGAGDGCVVRLYDQGGDATKALGAPTAAAQPYLVRGGLLHRNLNGQPTLFFDNVDDMLQTTAPMSQLITASAGTIAMVCRVDGKPASQPLDAVFWQTSAGDVSVAMFTDGATGLKGIRAGRAGLAAQQPLLVAPQPQAYSIAWLHVWRYGSNTLSTYLNSPVASSLTTSLGVSLSSSLQLAPRPVAASYASLFCEMVAYPTALDVPTLQTMADVMRHPYGMKFSGLPYQWPA